MFPRCVRGPVRPSRAYYDRKKDELYKYHRRPHRLARRGCDVLFAMLREDTTTNTHNRQPLDETLRDTLVSAGRYYTG